MDMTDLIGAQDAPAELARIAGTCAGKFREALVEMDVPEGEANMMTISIMTEVVNGIVRLVEPALNRFLDRRDGVPPAPDEVDR